MTPRILYIDDDPDHLAMVRLLLEKNFHAVVDVCCTAKGAELFLNEHCYELVISDIALTGELGTEIVAKILERDPEQPVLILSEYYGENIKEQIERLGVPRVGKFSHPNGIETFLETVATLLTKRRCPEAERRRSTDEQAGMNRRKAGGKIVITSPVVSEMRAALYAHTGWKES